MQKYNKYHSDVKLCYALGVEKQVLSENFVKEIPNTTSHYWKNNTAENFIGSEFSNSIQNALGDTQIFLDQRLEFPRKAFIQFARLYLTILSFIGKENLQALIKDNREVFLAAFDKSLMIFLYLKTGFFAFWVFLFTNIDCG